MLFVQFIINILYTHDVLVPSERMTYTDIVNGLPALILSCEMPIFAVLFLFAFSTGPYKGDKARGPMWKAVWDAFNVGDLALAFVRGPMWLVKSQRGRGGL